MDKETLLERLQQQKQHLEQELIQHIVNIENTIVSIQIIEYQNARSKQAVTSEGNKHPDWRGRTNHK